VNDVREAFSDTAEVVWRGLRIIAAHWPVLLTIFLLGQAVRNAALWAAVIVSDSNHLLGALLVPLAPLASLSALVLMLRTVSPSLRNTHFETDGSGAHPMRERLALLASTLVPFLAVYSAQGYLADDRQKWVNEANIDELQNGSSAWLAQGADTERTLIATGSSLLVLIALAFVFRWLIERFDLPDKHVGWGLAAAWLEVTWLTLLVHRLGPLFGLVSDWVTTRQLWVWGAATWQQLVGVLGPLGPALDGVKEWVWAVAGDSQTLVIVPLAWLTVGAIVFRRDADGVELATSYAAKANARVQGWLRMAPALVRTWVGRVMGDLAGRFAGIAQGIKVLVVAGLLQVVLFGLVFVLARQAEFGTYEVIRWVTGPMDYLDRQVLWPHFAVLAQAVYTLLIVGLLAAAIDRVLGRHDSAGAEASAHADL
jgi:hypothetical protein